MESRSVLIGMVILTTALGVGHIHAQTVSSNQDRHSPATIERAQWLQSYARGRKVTLDEAISFVLAYSPIILERALSLQIDTHERALAIEEAIQKVQENTPATIERAQWLQSHARGRKVTLDEAISFVLAYSPIILERALSLQIDTHERALTIEEAIQKAGGNSGTHQVADATRRIQARLTDDKLRIP